MRKKERDHKMFLDEIQTAMRRISEYIEGYNFEHFKRDYKTVDTVIRNFKIIGEASKNIGEKIKKSIQMFHGKKCTI